MPVPNSEINFKKQRQKRVKKLNRVTVIPKQTDVHKTLKETRRLLI